MRELRTEELEQISGGEGVCTPESAGNVYRGVSQPKKVGGDLIDIYEGMVAAASHVIERVALALKN